jgi:hypothetical protein
MPAKSARAPSTVASVLASLSADRKPPSSGESGGAFARSTMRKKGSIIAMVQVIASTSSPKRATTPASVCSTISHWKSKSVLMARRRGRRGARGEPRGRPPASATLPRRQSSRSLLHKAMVVRSEDARNAFPSAIRSAVIEGPPRLAGASGVRGAGGVGRGSVSRIPRRDEAAGVRAADY